MQFYEDIPRLYTALAEWGACMLYLYMIRGRLKSCLFWVSSAAFLVVQSMFLIFTDDLPTMFWIPCMFMAAGMMYLFLVLWGKISWISAVYCCAQAFLLAEFTASLEWQIHTFLQKEIAINLWQSALLLFLIYGGCFAVMYKITSPLLTGDYLTQISAKEAFSAAGIVVVVFAFSNLSFIYKNSPFSATLRSDMFNIRTLADMGGIAILHAYQSRIFEYLAEKELSAMNLVLKTQYDQYRNYQDSLDLIQMKYHDLKHQIAGLRAETDSVRRGEWLDAMEDELSSFETWNKTGNRVLDTILAAKIFHCRKNNIQITCVADGKILDFIHVIDICTIFGNALDNAIEHVVMIPEKEKRLIHVSVSQKKNFVFIKVENYCENEIIKNENQLISTTKSDKQNHGFGLKSMIQTAQKYNGSVDFGVKNNWFELKILLPRG